MTEHPERLIDPRTGRPKDGQHADSINANVVGAILGLLSVICGLFGFVLCCLPLNALFSLAALPLGGIAIFLRGTLGRVLGSAGLILSVISLVCTAAVFLSAVANVQRFKEQKDRELKAEQEVKVRDAIDKVFDEFKREAERNHIELDPKPNAPSPESAPQPGEPFNPLRQPTAPKTPED